MGIILALVNIITLYVLPSPFAQKSTPFFAERLAGVQGAEPGKKTAPAQRKLDPGATSPVIKSDPLPPFAPSGTTVYFAVDVPLRMLSVEISQP